MNEEIKNLYNSACLVLSEKQYSKSKSMFEELESILSLNQINSQEDYIYKESIRQIGYISMEMGDSDVAINYLFKAQVFFPNDVMIYHSLTFLASRRKKWKYYFYTWLLLAKNLKGVFQERYHYHLNRT